jgi:hypothetical protein
MALSSLSFIHFLASHNSLTVTLLLPIKVFHERIGKLSSCGTSRFKEQEIANTLQIKPQTLQDLYDQKATLVSL